MDGSQTTQPLISNDDLLEAVRSTSVLADVTIGLWSSEKTNSALMQEMQRDAGSTGTVGKMILNTLAGADGLLKEARSEYVAFRLMHYGLTLPWVSDPHALRQTGPRLLPNMLFENYLNRMSRQKREAEVARDKFLHEYPEACERARKNIASDMGGMQQGARKSILKQFADSYVYPSTAEVTNMFRVAFNFEPIAAGAQFRNLPPTMMGKLAAGLEKKQLAMIQTSQKAMWEEVRARVAKLCERMGTEDARFKLTTVENVRDLIVLLPGWNVTSNPAVPEIAVMLDTMLTGMDSVSVRGDADLRAVVAAQAAAVLAKLDQWGL